MKFVIFITRNCNLKCDYCYEKSMKKKRYGYSHGKLHNKFCKR